MMKRIINAILFAVGVMSVGAQDLATEITVDRTVLPEQRAAQRPSFLPSLLSLPMVQSNLQAAEYEQPGSIVNSLHGLAPSPWRNIIPKTPYRGYLTAGYMPAFNLGASLGYKVVDTDKAAVNLWGQYDGNQYKRDNIKLRNNFATINGDILYKVDDNSRLMAFVGYELGSVLHPSIFTEEPKFTQNANNIKVEAGWISKVDKVGYNLSARYSYFSMNGYAAGIDERTSVTPWNWIRPTDPKPHQSVIAFEGGVGLTRAQSPTEITERWLGLDWNGEFAHSDGAQGTLGEIHLDPYFRAKVSDLSLRIGAKFSFATGDYDTGLRVAPNVRLDYVPQDFFLSAWFTAEGGESLNTYSRLYSINPYFVPTQQIGRTNIPAAFGLGLNIGPISGFNIGVYGRFAMVRNWYAPVAGMTEGVANKDGTYSVLKYFQPVFVGYDANSWLFGARISYEYKQLLGIECTAEHGVSNHDYATWMEWMDRAKTRVSGVLRLSPLSVMDIQAGYELRLGRSGYDCNDGVYSIGDKHNLWAGVSYRISQQFTVWARGENLTNSNYLLINGCPAQGITGLAGISFKF